MSFTRILFVAGAGLLLIAGGIANAQDAKGKASRAVLGTHDERFLDHAAKASHHEMELGKLGTEKASNPKVKEFAQQLMDDHTKLYSEVEALAKEKGVTIPTSHAKAPSLTRLSKMSGAEFDKDFMRTVSMDHQREIAVYEAETKSGTDPAVKDFATKQLPMLQTHMDAVKALP